MVLNCYHFTFIENYISSEDKDDHWKSFCYMLEDVLITQWLSVFPVRYNIYIYIYTSGPVCSATRTLYSIYFRFLRVYRTSLRLKLNTSIKTFELSNRWNYILCFLWVFKEIIWFVETSWIMSINEHKYHT